MSIAITMQQTRRGEDGSMWLAGTTHTASDEFGATMVAANLATIAKGQSLPVRAGLRPADAGATTIPTHVVPYAPGGTVYYFDPSASVHGTGTFLSPFKDQRDLPFPESGSSLLFKQGTTYQPSGGTLVIIPNHLPTDEASAVVIGVYDATTGARLSGRRAGLATIDAQGTPVGIQADHANARAFIEVDGIKVINVVGNSSGAIKLKSVANCRVLNCEVSGAPGKGIYSDSAVGSSKFEGNVALDCELGGIVETLAADASSVFQFNSTCGIEVSGAHRANGSAACNTVQGVAARTSTGIAITTAGGTFHAHRNVVRQCKNGVSISGTSATPDDFAGCVLEQNQIELCKFGIQISNAVGVLHQNNDIDRSGTFDGTSPYDPADNFGRGVELYALDPAQGPRNCVGRFNVISRSFSRNPDGSEGVGYGFDNNATDCVAYGNLILDCDGCAIQANRTTRCTAAANIIVNAWCAPAGAYPSFAYTAGRLEGAIAHIVSPDWTAANNTIVCGTGFYSRYGFAEAYHTTDGGSPRARLLNNLVLGAPVAGILLDDTAGKTTEDHNIIQGGTAVVSAGTGAAVALGSGTHLLASYAEAGLSGASLAPVLESLCDATGSSVSPRLLSFAGKPLSYRTPIGALHAA